MMRILRQLSFALLFLSASLAFAHKAALVVIDMQPYFLTRGGSHLVPENQRKNGLVLARQARLIQVAKENHIPIIKIEFSGYGSTDSFLNQQIGDYEMTQTFLKRKDGMFHSESGVGEELKAHLNRLQVSELVISGANGGACVRCSIEGALNNGYRIWADSQAIIDFNVSDFVHPYRYGEEAFWVSDEALLTNFNQTDDAFKIESILKASPHSLQSPVRCSTVYH